MKEGEKERGGERDRTEAGGRIPGEEGEEEQSWPGHGTVAVCTIYQIFN